MSLTSLPTPCLLLDYNKHTKNISRMQNVVDGLGVHLRPHLKTMKSAEAAKGLIAAGAEGITVSTLKEVKYFLDHGITDITYAVGIVPAKLGEVASLMTQGAKLKILCDNVEIAKNIAHIANETGTVFKVLIEIDCGDNRGGLQPDAPALLSIARTIGESKAKLQGVLTHAGQSYDAKTPNAVINVAEAERLAITTAADRLRAAGIPVETVSMGSTPTALFTKDVTGITELRAGVYTLFDIDQQSRGICNMDDIAASVLTSVIGHNRAADKILVDAGALALSKDRGAEEDHPNAGFGQVCTVDGDPIEGLNVKSASQEHGHIMVRNDNDFTNHPIGSLVRILPIHACMTAAAYPHFHVIKNGELDGIWDRVNGW